MALHATAREANVRDSVKKFFVDNLKTIEGITVSFDKGLHSPSTQGQPINVDRWVNVDFGAMILGSLSRMFIEVICCTRNDSEGFKLAQLKDKVIGYLIDSTTYANVGTRIPLYRSYQSQAWVQVGTMVVSNVSESASLATVDETKFKTITMTLSWGTKI